MCSNTWWSVTVDDEFKKNPSLTQDHINCIIDWMLHQPHLPKISELRVIMFLQACQFNTDQTKETIEAYYSGRTALSEYFGSRDPESKDIQDISKVVHSSILPQCDQNGNFIIWGSLVDPDPSHYNFVAATKYFAMVTEVLQLEKGTVPGVVVVYDVKHMTFSHVRKIPLSLMTKYSHYAQEGTPYIVRAIHYINANPVLDKLICAMKPLLKSFTLNSIHIHSDVKSLFNFIPKDIVPRDYGGNELSLKDLNDENMKKFKTYRDWFTEEEKQRVDESKRITEMKTAKRTNAVPHSLQGTFKKLEID